MVEGTQVLAQAIVAVAKRFPDKSVRSVHAVFSRAVAVGPPVEFDLDVVAEGRSTATAVGRRAPERRALHHGDGFPTSRPPTSSATTPRPDVARPPTPTAPRCRWSGGNCGWSTSSTSTAPTRSGRRAVRVAALRPDPDPRRSGQGAGRVLHRPPGDFDDDARARRHRHRQSHLTVSTAPMTITVSFHEPVRWAGWLLYTP